MIKITAKADKKSIVQFIGEKELHLGESFSLPGDAECRLLSGVGKGIDTISVLSFVLDNINSISTGLVSAYIYDKLKGTETIEINGKVVPLKKEEIERELNNLKNTPTKDE